jgi:phosphate transport system substrate-binding protein
MSSKKGPPPIVYIVIAAFFASYFYNSRPKGKENPSPPVPIPANSDQTSADISVPQTLPSGTSVRIDGSTSMVQINQAFKAGFEQQFPGSNVITAAKGTDRGITDLALGKIDIAAISRELKPEERDRGLVAVPIVQDAIAIVVGNTNSFRTGLTSTQVEQIFTGKLQNWSEVGGKSLPLRVLNRPAISGTYQAFQAIVLKGNKFGTGSNLINLDRDATTPMLQALKTDGIGYATFAQVANQTTVRTVAIDGMTPESTNYPYRRTLSYVYRQPSSEGVKAFLAFATSPAGKQLIPDKIGSK